ncbi:uncharacterized protein LOC107362769 [Tetranychus urticae]|uniref:uncharacterized protein LOC107362769 n=1 Tax=Tetranychus urticae TaxID=32264 RepID=UPI00077BC77D|nr:uncharacterized protein LOC107362769 [Tetranychus urticae]
MGLKLELSKRRMIFALFSFLLVYMICELLFIGEFSTPDQENVYDYENDWYESNSTVCDLPFRMHPYDTTIKDLIRRKPNKIVCIKSDDGAYDSLYNLYQGQSLSYMNDDDPIVRIFRIRDHEKSLKCLYQPFDRDGNDDGIKFLEKRPIIGHKLDLEKIGAEFVNIECYLSGALVYSNIHSWPSRVPSHADATSSNNKDHSIINNYPTLYVNKQSVMFLVIESMSLLNFDRFMVKTKEALSKLSNNFILRGLNKMADNSYPNMMPLLSGYRPYYGEWPFEFEVGKGPYDDVQFIWDDFKRQNYTTGYIEDDPKFALFNYLAEGFKKPPTDWYPRPYWLRMDYEQGIESPTFCYKQKPKIIYWLKQIKQFLNKVNKTKQPFFLWSFYIQVTHEDFNNAQLIDQYIADFINSYRHILENTVFVIMGDHNNRYGPLFMTGYGQIETRMPLFNIHVPPQLLHKHKHLAHYLKMNEKRLTTWLDVREMLKDIVSGNYEPIVSFSKRDVYSVWREEVPLDRTCKDALIPMEFCLCLKRLNFPVDSQLAQIVSTALVTRLNQALSQFNNLCYQLSLKDVHSVKIVRLPGESNPNNRVEVTLSVNPSNGLFQAQLYLKNTKILNNSGIDDWMLEGDVSRLDSYGNQSLCINDRVLRKYCYCREVIHSR